MSPVISPGRVVYVTRHGETEWNRERRWQGRLNSPLTELGVSQGRQVGELLGSLISGPFSMVSSPLERALRTAHLMAQGLGIDVSEIETDALLVEMDMGDWEGRSGREIELEDPDARAIGDASKWSFAPPGGENHADVAQRARCWWEGVAEDGDPLVVVTHGMTSRLLRGVYLGLEPSEIVLQRHVHGTVFRLEGGAEQCFAIEGVDAR